MRTSFLCLSAFSLPLISAAAPLSPRQAIDSAGSSPAASPTIATFPSSVSARPSIARPSAATANASEIVDPTTTDPNWEFPEAFDRILSTNFSSVSCPSFFTQFLSSSEFTDCRPFSFLINTSSGFFKAQKQPEQLPYVLNGTCYAPPQCSSTMSSLVARIQEDEACGKDLKEGNALAALALEAFKNFDLYREVGCLKNEESGAYCFAEAVASKSADSSYFYNLPLGTSLPSGTKTSCESSCTKDLMGIYSSYAVDPQLAISETYRDAQTRVNRECGPDFALAASLQSSSTILRPGLWASVVLGLFAFYL